MALLQVPPAIWPHGKVPQPNNPPNQGTRHSACISLCTGDQFPDSLWNYSEDFDGLPWWYSG